MPRAVPPIARRTAVYTVVSCQACGRSLDPAQGDKHRPQSGEESEDDLGRIDDGFDPGTGRSNLDHGDWARTGAAAAATARSAAAGAVVVLAHAAAKAGAKADVTSEAMITV